VNRDLVCEQGSGLTEHASASLDRCPGAIVGEENTIGAAPGHYNWVAILEFRPITLTPKAPLAPAGP
jgi:hypothetical protein